MTDFYPSRHKLPMWLKLVYTVFMVVWIPCYWMAYGPTNFLYFCDIALFVTLVAIWKESRLLASAPAVGILMPQLLWCIDYSSGLLTGSFPIGMTDYMFDENIPLFYRSLSLFHGWLPVLLVYMVARLGYDRRALRFWTMTTWLVLTVCYLWMPAPPRPERVMGQVNPPVNINYVYGLDDKAAQAFMHPHVWFALLMAVMPVLIFLPTHWVLEKWRGRRF